MTPTTTPHDTVLLDVDGTLADTTYHHAIAWARAFDRVGLHPPLWQIHRAIGMGGDKLVSAVAGQEAEREHGEELRTAWEEEYAELLPEIVLLPGARELVLALADRGLRLALASSGKERFTEHVLELLDLPEGTLAASTSSEDADDSKPEPDILGAALEAAGGTSAIVIGDTPYDVAAAARMSAPCLALRSGGFGEEELTRAGAVLVSKVPQDLVDLDDATWQDILRSEPPRAADRVDSPLPG